MSDEIKSEPHPPSPATSPHPWGLAVYCGLRDTAELPSYHERLRAPTHLSDLANWPPTHLSDPADPSNWDAGTLAEDALTPLLQVHQIPLQSYYHVFELPIYKAFEVTI